ncbi:septum site-determining protein MinC [Paracoccus sp. MBLB3053]|uniref:Probable septum site-determining protein MinC n=1 Tax=Paracoccus aurantius TaxID=3073814 RepID=A0ABU2HWY3_9RHOB|nr:septum site-determining protein MinC [Paracoccus sp. MBLB3053]MDS9469262.1 septum site-determining protein MinC [Paracoccus sp. MBLB3053]
MQKEQFSESTSRQVARVKPVQIRGRFFTAVAIQLAGEADEGFFEALDVKLRQTPQFFENAPVVIDLEQSVGLDSSEAIGRIADQLRARKLSVFGIQNATDLQIAAAEKAGLILLPGGRNAPLDRVSRPDRRAEVVQAPVAKEPPLPGSRLVTQPVRSGQTIFADRGDLVIIGSVSSGAEVIASGNIHVYGRLRGRALAGVNGDVSARIFCNDLDAELLAIAGLYRTSENLGPDIPRQYVQVFLDDEKLRVETLK